LTRSMNLVWVHWAIGVVVLGRAPGNISNEFQLQRRIYNSDHSLNLVLAYTTHGGLQTPLH
jgi:hypothetical protein